MCNIWKNQYWVLWSHKKVISELWFSTHCILYYSSVYNRTLYTYTQWIHVEAWKRLLGFFVRGLQYRIILWYGQLSIHYDVFMYDTEFLLFSLTSFRHEVLATWGHCCTCMNYNYCVTLDSPCRKVLGFVSWINHAHLWRQGIL